jgi:membrane protein YdbS with pleckstrin-like domain
MIDWKFWCTIIGAACVIYTVMWFFVLPYITHTEPPSVIPYLVTMTLTLIIASVIIYPDKVREAFWR